MYPNNDEDDKNLAKKLLIGASELQRLYTQGKRITKRRHLISCTEGLNLVVYTHPLRKQVCIAFGYAVGEGEISYLASIINKAIEKGHYFFIAHKNMACAIVSPTKTLLYGILFTAITIINIPHLGPDLKILFQIASKTLLH